MVMEEVDQSCLPVRPRPIYGEATSGFLKRVAQANGYETLRQLGRTFRSFDMFCQALDLSFTERNGLFGPYPSYWGHSDFKNGLTAADFNYSQLRWCPLCFSESPHLRGQWLLKVSCVCTWHGVWLLECCSHCGRAQRSDRVNFEQCACGASLAGIQDIKFAPDSVRQLSRAIEDSIDGKSALADFPAMSLAEWLRLIGYLGQFSEIYQPSKPGKISKLHQLDTAIALMSEVSKILEHWPKDFHMLLWAIQGQSAAKASIRDTFGSLYHVLYRDLPGRCFQFLRDEFECYLHQYWPGMVCKRNRVFKPETVAKHPRLTLKQAAKKAGVAESTVRHFMRAGLITGDQIELPSGRKMYSIDEQSLAQIAVLAKGCVSLGQAAKQLALPECRVRELILGGFLKPLVSRVQDNAATWLIPKQQVQRLFFTDAGPNTGQPTIIVRHILKYWHLREGEWMDLVQSLSEHQLVPVGKLAEPVPLGDIMLDEQKVRQWLLEKRYASGATLSVDEAAQRLGLKQQVVYDLVKLGLLATIQDHLPGRRVTQVSLEDFRTHYISLAEYARSLDRAPRWLLQTLPVKPISGPMIDGSRQYFFRRSDVYSEAFSAGAGIKSELLLFN
jgi:DNA-binding transcriptional MerR regulator